METNLVIIVIISLVALGSLIGVFIKMKNGFGPFNLKVYGLTLVVFITALLALSDIPGERLTAAFGILGAIAGYLFGLKKENN